MSQLQIPAAPAGERLDSWKAIAAYLKRDVRTVRRWETREGLPVRRHAHNKLASVYAYASELDNWLDSRQAQLTRRPERRLRRALSVAALIVLIAAVSAPWIGREALPVPNDAAARRPVAGRLWTSATGEGLHPTLIPIPGVARALAISPDGDMVFVADMERSAIRIIRTSDNAITRSLPLPSAPFWLAASARGEVIYAGTVRGDVVRIHLQSGSIETLAAGIENLRDLALADDERSLLLATVYGGLRVLELPAGSVREVPTVQCPVSVAFGSARDLFYVGYQCGGPGGRRGHDAIDVRRPTTWEVVQTIAGPPQVVDEMAVSPDGTQLWVDGHDACFSSTYDRVGCPPASGSILNVYRTDDSRLLASLMLSGAPGLSGLTFFPDSSRVVIGGLRPMVVDAKSLRVVEEAPMPLTGYAVFTPDRGRAYIPTLDGRNVAVFDLAGAACVPPPMGMQHWWAGDGNAEDVHDGNPGELRNGAAPAPGWIGQGFQFDGIDDLVYAPAVATLGREFTFALWIKPRESSGRDAVLVDKAPGGRSGWRLLRATDGRLTFCHGGEGDACDAGSRWAVRAATRLPPGAWSHVSVVSTPAKLALYVNGVLAAATDITSRPDDTKAAIGIGGPVGNGGYFSGMIDEVQTFTRPLDAVEVRSLYAAGRSGLCVR